MSLATHQAAILHQFKHRPVATLEQLRSLGGISHMTVFRVLKQHGYFTSFNHNARYYTLCEIPRFDDRGLWFYRSIGFSRHRRLATTLVALVHDSLAGYLSAELALLLRTPVANLLTRLVDQQQLARRRLGRQVVYLALQPQRQEQQWLHRLANRSADRTGSLLPATLAPTSVLPVLAELIRSPNASADRLARTLEHRGILLAPPDVQAILSFYQLEKKEAH